MERPSAWQSYTPDQERELEQLAQAYAGFISRNKTERECVAEAIRMAEEAGYRSLESCVTEGTPLQPGDRVYASMRGKSLILAEIGVKDLTCGINILGAHVDSPRLDVKQNPLEEKNDLAYLDTHYYGGIKKYQWVTIPLAIHGVVAKKDGTVVPVVCCSSATRVGIAKLLDNIIDLMPSPAGKVLEGTNPKTGEAVERVCADDQPFSARVFKTMADPFVGKLSLMKVTSGVLEGSTALYNVNAEKTEKPGTIYILKGKQQSTTPCRRISSSDSV